LERAKLGSSADRYKAALYKAVEKATYDKLLALAGIKPGAGPGEIDPEKINQAIALCHELNKERPSKQDAEISFDDILALRAESTPSSDGSRPTRRGTQNLERQRTQGRRDDPRCHR
jgi:hypothetical protein